MKRSIDLKNIVFLLVVIFLLIIPSNNNLFATTLIYRLSHRQRGAHYLKSKVEIRVMYDF